MSNNPKKPSNESVPLYPMRINKYLALNKYSTRRGGDELVAQGRVFLNGKLAVLGDKVLETDKVEVRFRPGEKVRDFTYIAYHKPIGKTPTDFLFTKKRGLAKMSKDIFPIEDLDKDAHGLVLFTNDGRLTTALLAPDSMVPKEYLVKTKGVPRANFKEKMEAGVQLEDVMTRPARVQMIDENLFRITITDNHKHQIRRMCVALFAEVTDLKRIAIGTVRLDTLMEGSSRTLAGQELTDFKRALGF